MTPSIYLAFKFGARGGVWDKLIDWKTSGPYSHVELVLDGQRDAAECFSSRPGSGTGFAEIDLTDTTLWTVVPLRINRLHGEDVREFCDEFSKKSYDWVGILGFVLPFGEHDDHDRFCSEICTEVLQKVLGWWPQIKAWKISPNELYTLVCSSQLHLKGKN